MTLEEYFSAKACIEKQEDKPKKKAKTEEIKQHAAIDPVNSIPNENGVKEEVIIADINGNNFSTKGLNMKNYNEIDVLIKKRMETFSNKLKNTQGTRKTADINRKYKEKVKDGYETNKIDREIKAWKQLHSKDMKNFSIYDGVDHVRSIYSTLINGGGALNFDAKSLAKKIGKGALIAGGIGAAGLGTNHLTESILKNKVFKEIDTLDYPRRSLNNIKKEVLDSIDEIKRQNPGIKGEIYVKKYLKELDEKIDLIPGTENEHGRIWNLLGVDKDYTAVNENIYRTNEKYLPLGD